MLNQTILIGKLQGNIIKEGDKSYINLAVSRSFKNENGIYDVDIIRCELFNSIKNDIDELLSNNTVIGIKGRVQVIDNVQSIAVEKITLLSSNKKEG